MNLYDEIAVTAYVLFESRGRVHGYDFDDWLNAERIVLANHSGQDMEEPEEEGTEEFASVGAPVKRGPAEESDEPINEEMS